MTEAEWYRDFELMGNQVNSAIRIFHTNEEINRCVNENRRISDAINRAAEFWILHRNCLQSTLFIILGRIFDRSRDAHSLRKF